MRAATGWQDYELIDTTGGFRLERWGRHLLQRPDPQILWETPRKSGLWKKVDAVYRRSDKGGGGWEYKTRLPEKWSIGYKNLKLVVSPTGFKHTGVFPEQAVNWDEYTRLLTTAALNRPKDKPLRVLNLFGYTGGATLACLAAGAEVTHVDASKGMVGWAKENAAASGLAGKPARWMVDDCAKFVAREIRRGSLYHGVIMDPPSYGRGPSGEVWKLEDAIWPLLELTVQVLDKNPLFFTLNSYTTGLAPSVMGYMMEQLLPARFGGQVQCDEIGLPVTAAGSVLPCGATAFWTAEGA